MIKYDEEEFRKVCIESKTMAKAAAKLGIHFNSFSRIAKKLGCYFPNKSGKGISKLAPSIPVEEIISGKHPHYQTFKLKKKLLASGLKENRCEVCNIDSWNGLELQCELDHIDGNRNNHMLDNLRMICPNCHSQTINFRAKNIK